MNFKYTITIVMFFMILALSRGFVLTQYDDLASFGVLHAFAEGDGGGGAGGGGDGGGGAGGGDGAAGGGGDTGTPATVVGCMDSFATNYDPAATDQTGVTCTYPIHGCMDPFATNYNSGATDQVGVTCTYPIHGCMDPFATNYNSGATDQVGVTCSYPIHGCMDSTATNYNSGATDQVGVTCTYASAPIYGCMDSTATNYNSAATSQTGVTCTYAPPPPPPAPIYGCMDSTATNYNSAATSQTGVTCTYVVVPPPSGGGGGGGGGSGGGGGGGSYSPTITLAVLPHMSAQPLAYLYLSQIPYTGVDLGPFGTMIYWLVLIIGSMALAYYILFSATPLVNRFARNFGAQVSGVLNAPRLAPAVPAHQPEIYVAPLPLEEATIAEAPRGYSPYEGFKSFAHNGALSIEDIVKALSREHALHAVHHRAGSVEIPHVEPVYENVEPIYEQVEPIAEDVPQVASPAPEKLNRSEVTAVPADVRGLAAALVEGDRGAVFAGLRQYVRGGGAPEHLVTSVVCLLDDTYRARIDGTSCDATIARLTARLDTPKLEKLISALSTAIDSSYSDSVTGAKLAFTRALSVLGV